MCLSFLSSIFLLIRMILNTCFSTGLHIIRVWNHALLLVYSTYALKLYLYNNISNHSLEVFKSFIFNSGHNNIIGFEFIFEWFLSFFYLLESSTWMYEKLAWITFSQSSVRDPWSQPVFLWIITASLRVLFSLIGFLSLNETSNSEILHSCKQEDHFLQSFIRTLISTCGILHFWKKLRNNAETQLKQ